MREEGKESMRKYDFWEEPEDRKLEMYNEITNCNLYYLRRD